MEKIKKYLKISELSKFSGFPVSKIKYYIRIGILQKPIKIGKTSALYDSKHIERLSLIKELHNNKKLSLNSIKQFIEYSLTDNNPEKVEETKGFEIIRCEIIDASIDVFRTKGFERTTISDIVASAGIARNAFYQHFKNKRELFIECIDKLFLDWRQEAPTDPNIENVIRKLMFSFFKAFPKWNDMMNHLRSSATKYPEVFGDRLEASLTTRINPVINDVKKGIESGLFRKELDSQIAGIMMAGASEYMCYFMMRGAFNEKDTDIVEKALDFWFYGLKKQ